MDNKEDIKLPENEEFKKPKSSKLFTVLGVIVMLIFSAIIVTASLSKLSDNREKNALNGYNGFEYCKEYKVNQVTAKECTIGNNTYKLIEKSRENYYLENKGKYNGYGFYFGEGPDFFMMNYDSTNTEFWFQKSPMKYPEVGRETVTDLIIPADETEVFAGGDTGINRISFGNSPLDITDKQIIEQAVNEYKNTLQFSYSTELVPDNTPIFAKFSDSSLYFLIGYTTEE